MKDSKSGNLTFAEAPTPLKLYIHDDVSEEIRLQHGPASEPLRLIEKLFGLAQRDRPSVEVLRQFRRLVATGPNPPFSATIRIGVAGERVAREVHRRTGWFPVIRRDDVAREEDCTGGYTVVTQVPAHSKPSWKG